ncbi:MAG: hypothetical protein OXC80_07585 [Gammaproteobacteria bacterium]|nr:hypothetical protein [Gammaproteobacteria bacterium]
MALQEATFNNALAEMLNQMSNNWEVTAELTEEFQEKKSLVPDILIATDQRTYVAIENEFAPASTVESDALSRIGKKLSRSGTQLAQVVALKTPLSMRECRSVNEAKRKIPTINFEFALYQGHFDLSQGDEAVGEIYRTPSNDSLLQGDIETLAEFLINSSVNNRTLQASLHELDRGVQDSIAILTEAVSKNSQLKSDFAELFRQTFSDEDMQQGLGIATTVVINATLFQERLSTKYANVLSLAQMKSDNLLNQSGLIEQWEEILKINYWPIYSIAIGVLRNIADPYLVAQFIKRLSKTTQSLVELKIVETHDLCGVIFQRFMTDRKYLASFYTRPESASLLAYLAVPKLDWSDKEVYSNFKFADYACGTGTLVHAVYRRLIHLHEFRGGEPGELHDVMMGKNISGADIVPSATHLTATLLSSLFPDETYDNSMIVVPNYGVGQNGTDVSLGSLELLDDDQVLNTMFPNPVDGEAVGPKNLDGFSYQMSFEQSSQDLVIMNPPYTRTMSDWNLVKNEEGTWKPYNALGNSTATQKDMQIREKYLSTKIPCYNGYHSMPSMFCGLAHRMLKEGGTFAFVLPLTSVQSVSWHKFRKMMSSDYFDVLVISIAQDTAIACSWSADTKLAEVLIIARKNDPNLQQAEVVQGRATVVNLHDRPSNTMIATHYSSMIRTVIESNLIRSIEDGPIGGTPVKVGEKVIGEALSIPISQYPWNATGIRDLTLAQWCHQLKSGHLWFPRLPDSEEEVITIRTIGSFASLGYGDGMIANSQTAAFDRIEVTPSPNYPMIWQNDSDSQRRMRFHADQEGRIRPGKEVDAQKIWDSSSSAVIARECSFSSQSLICGYSHHPVIGGRGWPNVKLEKQSHEKVFVLWGSTCLGLISYWYFSSRQQVRRSLVAISGIKEIPWLDPTSLTESQLLRASQLFDEYESKTFLPAGQANKDPIRMQLDEKFLVGILEFPTDVYKSVEFLRDKWCSEPAVMSN